MLGMQTGRWRRSYPLKDGARCAEIINSNRLRLGLIATEPAMRFTEVQGPQAEVIARCHPREKRKRMLGARASRPQ